MNDSQGAAKNFKKALEINSNDVTALMNSAAVSMAEGNPKRALECLDLAVELSPGPAHLYIRRALANETLGKTEEAKADLEKAKSLGNAKMKTINSIDLLFP